MSQGQPNIVLIFVDNQPANMLGCSGNDEIHTPNLDRLASRGTRFSNAFCPNAMCSPCRASVLTGLMPSQHGVHTWIDEGVMDTWPDNWNAIDEFRSLPERLLDDGYDTALFGKYHLGLADEPQNGFKTWVTMQIGHVQSFYDNLMIKDGKSFVHPGHSVDFFTEHAVDYIADQAATPEDPFFMFLTYPAPYGHWPSIQGEPTNRFADKYRDTPFNSVPREGVSDELMDWLRVRHERVTEEYPSYVEDLVQLLNDMPSLRNYYSQMSMVDSGVGKVLGALEEHNLDDNTLVIYTSDHGMSLGEHGFWGHGEDTWPSNTHREANHIPLIIKTPAQSNGGKTSEQMVGTIDLFSTVLDYAGSDSPDPAETSAQSLRKLIEDPDADWRDAVFMEQEETRSIRTREWLFMQRFGPTDFNFHDELYDLRNDPGERKNLAEDPEYKSVVDTLTKRITEQFEQYSNPKWSLWSGGSVKSNSGRPFLWRDVWGEDWKPTF